MNGLSEQWSEALASAPQRAAPGGLFELPEKAAGPIRYTRQPHPKGEAGKA